MRGTTPGERVAFFGGSFDPPHMGHLAIARAARDALRLQRVLFAPVGAQPLKPGGAVACFEDRIAMTRLAIEDEPGFEISLADAPVGSPNYTLETLHTLRRKLPEAARLFCLMGADAFAALKLWRGAAEVPFAATLVVASRPGTPLEHLALGLPAKLSVERRERVRADYETEKWFLTAGSGAIAEMYVLPGLHVDVSATEIRQQVRATVLGRTTELIPAGVARYIGQHGLYL